MYEFNQIPAVFESRLLPEKLSQVLREAVKDLRACEANPRYVIDMSKWYYDRSPYNPAAIGTCKVCLAGVVIANRYVMNPTFGEELKEKFTDSSSAGYSGTTSINLGSIAIAGLCEQDTNMLRALDYCRLGNVQMAAITSIPMYSEKRMCESLQELPYKYKEHYSYEEDPIKFYESMEAIAQILEDAGF